MSRRLKIILKIAGALVCLLVLLWCGLAAYIYSHKKSVLESITVQLSRRIHGQIRIASMEPTLIRGFPGMSVALRGVTLEDSLYPQHRRRLLEAKNIYVSVDMLSVLDKNPRIRDISVTDGKLYLFTDSTGYSNSSIFSKGEGEGDHSAKLNKISLIRVQFVMEHQAKHKLFRLYFHRMVGKIRYDNTGWSAAVQIRARIQDFTFNTDKGSYLKNKLLVTSLDIRYDRAKQIASIPRQRIKLDREVLQLGGKFFLEESPVRFELQLGAPGISYAAALSLLSPNISSKLKAFGLEQPLDIEGVIRGRMKYRDTPLVLMQLKVRNNVLVTPVGKIPNCSFDGSFSNERNPGEGHNDPNSVIRLYGLKGSWQEIPFRADTLYVSNLRNPVLEGRFLSSFPLSRLNPVIGSRSFSFIKGKASLDLLYKGGIRKEDTTKAYVYGSIRATDATIDYLPRGLRFANSSATVVFKGRDLYISNVQLSQQGSVLQMNGSMLNFLSLYYTDPGKMLLDWHVSSPRIDLDDFKGFLGKRKEVMLPAEEHSGNEEAVSRMSTQMDKVLAACSVRLGLSVAEVVYHQFQASGIEADVVLNNTAILLDHVSLRHAGGTLDIRGNIAQQGPVNPFSINADIKNVAVGTFFRSFENFGQDAITDKNISGNLFARAEVSGSVRDNGKILPYSLNGSLSFDLQDGALRQFEPLRNIGKFIFRNRDLGNVTIHKLRDSFLLRGDKVIINPMLIESSALNIKVAGTYAFTKGTDIRIDVPLRNPDKDGFISDDSTRKERSMKGIILHLQAVDGDNGNVKIRLRRKGKEEDVH